MHIHIRKLLAILAVFAMTLGFAACSASPDGGESTKMKTVQTDKGEVEIPEHPTRIISDYYLGEFLAVDVKPVIASPYALNNPYLKDYVEGIEPMNITSGPMSRKRTLILESRQILPILRKISSASSLDSGAHYPLDPFLLPSSKESISDSSWLKAHQSTRG